jgi:hypothetical protein
MGMKLINSTEPFTRNAGLKPSANETADGAIRPAGRLEDTSDQSNRTLMDIKRSILMKLTLRLGEGKCFGDSK